MNPVYFDFACGNGAVISECDTYRYFLSRVIASGPATPVPVNFIMLNPSTADDSIDDPTIRKCKGFAQRWGCNRVWVTNLFAFRATKPAELKKAQAPTGFWNRHWLQAVACKTVSLGGLVVCAWGQHGRLLDAHAEIEGLLRDTVPVANLQAIGFTKDGLPRHPLMLSYLEGRQAMRWR